MAELPRVTARRPVPSFGQADQANPVVASGDVPRGRAINQLGQAMMTTFLRAQAEENRYMVEDATTRLKQAQLDLAKGDNGFMHVRGADISKEKDFHEQRMSQFDQAVSEISEDLGNSAQSQAFAGRAELARVNYGENLINHITNENDKFKTQTYVGGVASEQDIAALSPNDPSVIYQSLDRIKELTEAEAAREGYAGERKPVWHPCRGYSGAGGQ